MTRYPLRLRLDGRLAVVVGGGATAARQAATLGAAGASVLVVAEWLSPPLAEQAAGGLIAARRGRYRAADLNGAWLVLACDADPAVNAEVAADAEQRRLWCLTAGDLDEPGDLDERGDLDAPAVDAGPAGRRVLVLGGARSGKSVTAERFLGGDGPDGRPVEYVATGTPPGPEDAEWAARIAAHRARRPGRWRTTETTDLEAVLTARDRDPVLIDCLSLWIARVMDECGAWAEDDAADSGGSHATAAGRDAAEAAVAARVGRLLDAWRATTRLVVAVSNEVGCGVVPATSSGRRYRDALGRLNAQVAAVSDEVWFCTAGLPRRLR